MSDLLFLTHLLIIEAEPCKCKIYMTRTLIKTIADINSLD